MVAAKQILNEEIMPAILCIYTYMVAVACIIEFVVVVVVETVDLDQCVRTTLCNKYTVFYSHQCLNVQKATASARNTKSEQHTVCDSSSFIANNYILLSCIQ